MEPPAGVLPLNINDTVVVRLTPIGLRYLESWLEKQATDDEPVLFLAQQRQVELPPGVGVGGQMAWAFQLYELMDCFARFYSDTHGGIAANAQLFVGNWIGVKR